MTALNREIQATSDNDSARPSQYSGRYCFVAALLLATLGVTANATPYTFNDPTPTSEDHFGARVALDGNNVLIGANDEVTTGIYIGQAHLFDAVTGNLLRTFDDPTPTVGDRFGWSVALDSNRVLIGADGDDTNGENVGQAYLFTIALAADFDSDSDVDGGDFLAWQSGFGTQSGAQKSDGDYDNDGDVDGDDLLGWQIEFGSDSGSASVAVPEPSSWLLLAVGLALCLTNRSGTRFVHAA